MSPLRIELRSRSDCPHATPVRVLLAAAMTRVGIEGPVIDIVGRYPSPSVLVDGNDVMRPGVEQRGHMCRLDVPTLHDLLDALRAAQTRHGPTP